MHIVIVEDEPLVLSRLERLSKKILLDSVDRMSCFSNLDDAATFLDSTAVDIVLLDLNLHGKDGFTLLREYVAAGFHTIVVSAYADKAIEAFEYGVLDFVAKPFTQERLAKALNRVVDSQLRSHFGCRYLGVKKTSGIELIEIRDIAYIQAEGHYTLLHIPRQQPILHSKSIERLSSVLPQNFCRVHRSHIVNMNYAKQLRINAGSRYELELTGGELVPVGRTRYKAVLHHLEG